MAPDPTFKRRPLVRNRFAWWLVAIAAALWPVAVAMPYKLAIVIGGLFPALLQLFGVFCLFVVAVCWLIFLAMALYRRYWRYASSLMVALVVFFVVGGSVGYRL